MAKTDAVQLHVRERNALETPTDLDRKGVSEIAGNLRQLLADVFALYVKTKNFHWHMSGQHFRDYHLLLDEQSEQIFAMTDDIAERARKIGGTTIRSIGGERHNDIATASLIETWIDQTERRTWFLAEIAPTL